VGTIRGVLKTSSHPTVVYAGVGVINIEGAAGINALYGPDTSDRATAFAGLTAQERFVQALYLDALGRAGTKAELDGWAALFGGPGVAQQQAQATIAFDIEHSAEARDRLVRSWYATFLVRPTIPGEEQGWVNLLLQGQTEEQVLSQILASTEFYNRAQTLNLAGTADQRYVEALYELVLNRGAVDPNAEAGWVAALPQLGRQGVAMAFLQTQEFRSNQFEGYYNALLHRPDDPTGLNTWAMSNLDMNSVRIGFESTAEFFANG
jgi:hypothetical protein